jgi:hypothetical protein
MKCDGGCEPADQMEEVRSPASTALASHLLPCDVLLGSGRHRLRHGKQVGVRTSKLETREIIENFIFYASVAMTKPCK